MFDFSASRSVVLGGSSGIGFHIARELSANGSRVIIASRNEQKLESASRRMADSSAPVSPLVLDVSDRESRGAFVGEVSKLADSLDHLVFAAGVFTGASIEETTEEVWDQTVDTNLKGAYFAIRDLLPFLDRGRGKSIVLITSILASFGAPGVSAYAASKAGLVALAKSLSIELAPRRIRVNSVSPSYARTPMVESLLDSAYEEILARHPLARIGEPADVANTVQFLLSELSGWTTGQDFILDGGRSVNI